MTRLCMTIAALLASMMVASSACPAQLASSDRVPAGLYHTLYATDWTNGIDTAIGVQSPGPGAVVVVNDPVASERKAVRVRLRGTRILPVSQTARRERNWCFRTL